MGRLLHRLTVRQQARARRRASPPGRLALVPSERRAALGRRTRRVSPPGCATDRWSAVLLPQTAGASGDSSGPRRSVAKERRRQRRRWCRRDARIRRLSSSVDRAENLFPCGREPAIARIAADYCIAPAADASAWPDADARSTALPLRQAQEQRLRRVRCLLRHARRLLEQAVHRDGASSKQQSAARFHAAAFDRSRRDAPIREAAAPLANQQ
jgi:hypothetical protein